jgi:glycosyl hydrolase family 26
MLSIIQRAVHAFLYPGDADLFVRIVTAGYALSAVGRLLPVRRKQIAGYRPNPRRTTVITAGGVLIASGLAACAMVLPVQGHAPAQATMLTEGSGPELGVFEPGEWVSWQPVEQFASATGRNPSIVLLYSGWPGPFNAKFADMAYAHKATPFIQIMPAGDVSMSRVAEGSYDSELRTYAAQVRAFGHVVILSFAPEANGSWYRWGWGHTPASVWVAAWRHVVTVFREQGATNATWLWTMNIPFTHSGPVSAYWPGAAYVGIVGIDGYFIHRSDTFTSVFGPIISQVRKFTSKPVLISETAVGPVAGPSKIGGLFAGVKADHLLGLVWFDQAQHDGPYHQDWRLEDNPAVLGAYRTAARNAAAPRVRGP